MSNYDDDYDDYDDYGYEDDGNDWSDRKKLGAASDNFIKLGDLQYGGSLSAGGYFSGMVGDGDKVAYAQFSFCAPAKLSFYVESSSSLTFTLYKLTGKRGNYSLQTLQTSTTKKYVERDEEGDIIDAYYYVTTPSYFFKDTWGKDVEYYLSVKPVNPKREMDFYVTLSEKSSFFDEAMDGDVDDWNDRKENGKESTQLAEIDVESLYGGDGFSGWVGYHDSVDYSRFTLERNAKLSFTISSSASNVQISIGELNGKKNTLKTLSTATVSKIKRKKQYDEYGDLLEDYDEMEYKYSASTKTVLLKPGEYYIAVKSLNASKGGSADYTISVNNSKSTFFEGAEDGALDDWTDRKEVGGESGMLGEGFVLNEDYLDSYETRSGWVGMGDTYDFIPFTVEKSAKVNFSVYATSASTKFTVYSLVGTQGDYSLKKLKSTTFTQRSYPYTYWGDDDGPSSYNYGGKVKSLLLNRGTYYLRVESTNAAKGGSSNYLISYDYSSFAADDGWNNRILDDSKRLPEDEGFYYLDSNALTISYDMEDIVFEDTPMEYEKPIIAEESWLWDNYVGFGDEVDYKKITLDGRTKLSFAIEATGKAKFVIFKLVPDGDDTYKQKALQTTTLSQKTKTIRYTVDTSYDYDYDYDYDDDWDDVDYEVTKKYKYSYYGAKTKAIWLDAGDYYLAVRSTNAKNGGRAYYNVALRSVVFDDDYECSLSGPESGLDLPETDAIASDDLNTRDELFAGLPAPEAFADGSGVSALQDSATENSLLRQSAGLLS